MNQAVPFLILGAVLATLPLFLAKAGRRGARQVRVLLNVISCQAFGVAGWLFARHGDTWLGGILLLIGFFWIGLFWIASIRKRFRETPESADVSKSTIDGEDTEAFVGPADAELQPHGRAILRRLLAMREQKIGTIATPRELIVFADRAGGIDEACDRIRKTGHLRIPMVDGTLERIVGVVHAKDVIPLVVEGGNQRPPLKMLMRRPLFVSRDQSMASLLEIFRSQRGHLAIVVDPYGRTLGLVSRQDVFRHLTGGPEVEG